MKTRKTLDEIETINNSNCNQSNGFDFKPLNQVLNSQSEISELGENIDQTLITSKHEANLSDQKRDEKHFDYDEVMSDIGFGRFHMMLFVLMGLVGSIDGSETTCISLVIPVLKKQWGISKAEESLMGSIVYGGYMLGNVLSGIVGDKYGRRKPLIFASALATVFAFLSALSPHYIYFIIFRGCFGSTVGFMVPLSFTILAENTPVRSRGRFLTLIGILYTMGEMLAVLLAFLTFNNLKSGNWRALLAWSSLPAILTCAGCIFVMKESGRFDILKGDFSNGIKTIKFIARLNQKGADYLSTEHYVDVNNVDRWRNQEHQIQNQQNQIKEGAQLTIAKLFQGSFKYITPIIWYNWFSNAFIYYGISFLIPITLAATSNTPSNKKHDDSDDNDLTKLFLTTLAELPTPFIACIITEIKWFGRRYSLAASYFFAGICAILIQLKFPPDFTFWAGASKLFANLAFTLNYQYTGELYPTFIRTTGLGFANSFSGLGQLIMPWIGIYIGAIGTYIPYLIFGICSMLAGGFTCLIKFETRLKPLDIFK